MEWTFEAAGPVEADIVVPAGRVEIEGGSTDRIVVHLTPTGESSRRANDVIAAADVTLANEKLRVHVPRRKFQSVEVLCRIVVPEGSRVASKTASADLHSTGRLGAVRATTASGDVSLADVDSDVLVTSASGDFSCLAVGGSLRVRGASGDVSVRRAGGNVDISVASGDVDIADAATEVKARTASGDIRVGRAHAGRLSADSASGDIVVGVAAGVGAYVDVATLSGAMACSLPLEETSPEEAALEDRLPHRERGRAHRGGSMNWQLARLLAEDHQSRFGGSAPRSGSWDRQARTPLRPRAIAYLGARTRHGLGWLLVDAGLKLIGSSDAL